MKTPKIKRKNHIKPIDKSLNSKLRNVGIYINIFTFIIGLLSLPFNNYADYFVVILLFIPIACIIITRFYNQIFEFGSRLKNDNSNSIFFYPLLISFAFSIGRSFIFHTLENKNIIIFTLIFAAIFIIIILFKNNEFYINGKLVWILIPLESIIFPLAFAFSLARNINHVFDYSQPKLYYSKVLLKNESHIKNDNYNFDLETIKDQKNYHNLIVNKSLYQNTEINDTVTLKIYSGLLNAPYYEVVEK